MTMRSLAVLVVLALVVAGCGGSGKKSNRAKAYTDTTAQSTAAPSSGNAVQQDAEAKANARTLVTGVEACFVDQQMYSACKNPPGIKLPLGSGAGQVEVSAAATATYTVVAHSKSGTNFTVEKKPDGSMSRTCDKAGQGGCKAGGSW